MGGYKYLMDNYRSGDKVCLFGRYLLSRLGLLLIHKQASLVEHTLLARWLEC